MTIRLLKYVFRFWIILLFYFIVIGPSEISKEQNKYLCKNSISGLLSSSEIAKSTISISLKKNTIASKAKGKQNNGEDEENTRTKSDEIMVILIILLGLSLVFFLLFRCRIKVKKKLHNLKFKKDIELTKEINKISNKRDFALNIRLRKYCTNSIPKLLQKIDNEDVVRETQTNMKEINTFLKKYYYNDFDGIVLNFKVQRSVELLSRSKENKYNLSQISEACGFKDTQEYHRYFHKIIGVSPGEYREVLYSNQKKNKVEKIKMNLQ